MSIDRRQFKRFEALLIVEVAPQQESSSYFFGITKNVSFEGFIFESQNYNLQPGDILEFRLKHPKNSLSVPVFGEIVWNRETKFECLSGVKFHRFDSETRSKVFELISADSIELSAGVPIREEARSVPKRNGKSEPENKERDDMLSDIIGQAASHTTGKQTGKDKGNGEYLPVDDRKYTQNRGLETAGGEVTADAAKVDNQEPDVRKAEEKSVQENVSVAANGSSAVRRKGHKKSRPLARLLTVFLVLLIATALLLYASDDIRTNIFDRFVSRFIDNTETVIQDSGGSVLNEPRISEPPPVLMREPASLPDGDMQTPDEPMPAQTDTPIDQNGHEDLADSDKNGTAEQFKSLPATEEVAAVHNNKILLQKAEGQPAQPSAGLQDISDRVKETGGQGHISMEEPAAHSIIKVEVAASEKKKEAVRKISAAVQEAAKPVKQAIPGNRAKSPAASGDAVSLQQESVQKRAKTVSDTTTDRSKRISEPQQTDAVTNKRKTVPEPDGTPGDTLKNVKTAAPPVQEKEKEVQAKGNLGGSSGRVTETVKKSEVRVESDPVVVKTSIPESQTAAETSITRTDTPRPETAESAPAHMKDEQTVPLNGSEPKTQVVQIISKQSLSEKAEDRDAMPKIALVLENSQASASDIMNKPEITDEYLIKYFTVYNDDFNDNSNNWDIFDIGAASARIEDGLYHIENKKQGGALIVLHYQRFPHESDFVLEIAIRPVKGLDRNSFGIIFGAKDARNNYSFQITENKFYSVRNYHHGVSGELASGEIKNALTNNSPALLKIVKQADDIHFYVDNWYADKVSNLEFYGNQIGFIVEGKSHIAIDSTRSYIRKAEK